MMMMMMIISRLNFTGDPVPAPDSRVRIIPEFPSRGHFQGILYLLMRLPMTAENKT